MDYYYYIRSPPCVPAIFLAKKLGIEFNLKQTDVYNPADLHALTQINPQHTIPTLVDNGHVVSESYAILIYLVEKYAKDDALYPKDPKVRSVVNQRLFFDAGTLAPAMMSHSWAMVKNDPISEEMSNKLRNALGFLETFLTERTFVAADHLTIADLPLLNSTLTLRFFNHDLNPYPNIQAWITRTSAAIPDCQRIREESEESVKVFIASKR